MKKDVICILGIFFAALSITACSKKDEISTESSDNKPQSAYSEPAKTIVAKEGSNEGLNSAYDYASSYVFYRDCAALRFAGWTFAVRVSTGSNEDTARVEMAKKNFKYYEEVTLRMKMAQGLSRDEAKEYLKNNASPLRRYATDDQASNRDREKLEKIIESCDDRLVTDPVVLEIIKNFDPN